MTPERVYEKFCQEFPGMMAQVVKYFSHRTDEFDSGCIRILLKTGKTMIFGVNKDGSFTLRRK